MSRQFVLAATGTLACRTQSNIGCPFPITQNLYVGREIGIACSMSSYRCRILQTAYTLPFLRHLIPLHHGHPNGQINSIGKQRNKYAGKRVRRLIALKTQITISRYFRTQLFLHSAVQHVGHRKCVRPKIRRSYACRLSQIRLINRHKRRSACTNQ